MRKRPVRISVSNAFDNELFEILPDSLADADMAAQYADHVRIANPMEVPEKASFRNGFFSHQVNRYMEGFDYYAPKYKDGLLECVTTYVDVHGTPITFPAEAADGIFLSESSEYPNHTAFAGSKFFNWGWIQLTDKHKNSCYQALYNHVENTLYTLPNGFEMSRLDHNGEAVLYQLAADRQLIKAHRIALKMHPVIMLHASNILYPWEDDKVYSDVSPVVDGENVLVPFQTVFEHLFAEVTWNPVANTVTAIKGEHSLSVTVGSSDALLNGDRFSMRIPPSMMHGRVMVSLEAVSAFFSITVQWDLDKKLVRLVKERPYWEKWRRVENSYTTIPLSSLDPYPDYLQAEADNTVDDIQSIVATRLSSIAFMADAHYTPCENDHIRLQRTLNTYRDIAGKVKLDGLVLGGDRIFEASKEVRVQALQSYRDHFSGISYYPINGNHDPGGQWDGYVLKSESSTHHFTKNELHSGFYDHLTENNVVFNEKDPDNQLYYYLDKPEQKVRYIFLDSSDIPQELDENGKIVYNPIGWLAFSQMQLDWLACEALNMKENGWTVLLFAHEIANPSLAVDYAMTLKKNRHTHAIVSLLDAYRRGEDIDSTLYSEHPDYTVRLKYCFSEYRRATIAGVVMGNKHTDYVDYSETKIPYIHTASAYAAVMKRMNAPKRSDGSKAEVLFDIVTICQDNSTLYLSRVGAGFDRVIKYE